VSDDDRELRSILEALEGAPAGEGPRDEETETLVRLYSEVLGLLPQELEPVAPSPEIRQRLLRAIGHASPGTVPAKPNALALPDPRPARPASGPVALPRRRARRWPLAVAAAVAILSLGFAGWLFVGLREQGETIARLTRELATARRQAERAEAVQAEADRAYAELVEAREQLKLVTSPAVEVSAMRPAGGQPLQPRARGILFVAADHQHWYLCLEGLAPAAQGKAYVLWFVAGDNPVASGAFTASAEEPVELRDVRMPAGTKQVVVTLEDDPKAQKPAGPAVLQAGTMVPIL
jgi:hypothetical protein